MMNVLQGTQVTRRLPDAGPGKRAGGQLGGRVFLWDLMGEGRQGEEGPGLLQERTWGWRQV